MLKNDTAVWLTLCALCICSVFFGCEEKKPKQTREKPVVVAPEAAPEIRVHPDEAGHIYRYFPTGERAAKTSMSIEGVPTAARDLVIVIPEAGAPAGLAYVADLRSATDDGSYMYRVVPTNELDKALNESRGPIASEAEGDESKAATPSAKDEVVMFSASWCGVCTQARRWFRNKGIEVQERDIEKDKSARGDMLDMAKKAGADGSRLSGVPVIFVNGQMFPGFDPYKIQGALKAASAG